MTNATFTSDSNKSVKTHFSCTEVKEAAFSHSYITLANYSHNKLHCGQSMQVGPSYTLEGLGPWTNIQSEMMTR